MFDFFGDPRHSIADQALKAYEHRDDWGNRMILGDSLAVMNSLLEYEGLGGQVQMIYMDPSARPQARVTQAVSQRLARLAREARGRERRARAPEARRQDDTP